MSGHPHYPTDHTIRATFKRLGEFFNPSSVTFTVKDDNGAMATYNTGSSYPPASVANPSTGIFELTLKVTSKTKKWVVECKGTDSAGREVTAYIQIV